MKNLNKIYNNHRFTKMNHSNIQFSNQILMIFFMRISKQLKKRNLNKTNVKNSVNDLKLEYSNGEID